MAGNIRLYNTSGYVELQAPASASAQTLVLPTDSIQPGLVKIADQSFSAVSSVSLNNCFTSTYQNYRIVVQYTASANADTNIRLRASGSDDSGATNYAYSFSAFSFTGSSDTGNSNGTSLWRIGSNDTQRNGLSIDIYGPQLLQRTTANARLTGWVTVGTAAGGRYTFGGSHTQASAYDGFSFYTNSGTITGNIRVYGYRN